VPLPAESDGFQIALDTQCATDRLARIVGAATAEERETL
jgi:hypothetical protein